MAVLSTLLGVSSLIALSSATIKFDINKNHEVQGRQLARRQEYLQKRGFEKRADTVGVTLTNAETQGLYFANISIGTPAQKFAVQIDTGSSDLWVPATSSDQCQGTNSQTQSSSGGEVGCPDGSFDQTKSSTFDVVGENEFNISYVDGTGTNGDYFQDTLQIGGVTLNNFEMGLGLTSTIGTGIMGIGYNNSEANTQTGNGTVYANLPQAMVNNGLIKANAYSLWLNDLEATSGSVLFGGIDTDKYHGDLVSVDVYPTSRNGIISSFTVAWTSFSATSSSGSDQITPDDFAVAAILDSGTTITLLPDDVAQVVYEELGATVSQSLGAVVVPCSLAENTGTLNYGFGGVGGPTIKVAVSNLVLPLTLTNGKSPHYENGEAACQLGIQAAGDLPVLFGDTFLRDAYVVYDLDNNRIALAQTDFNATGSNIVAFESVGAAIPSASTAPNEAAVTQTATGVPKVVATPGADGSAAATYNPTATGLDAAAGFETNTASSSGSSGSSGSSTKKSAAGVGPKPFAWSGVFVAGITIAGMGMGAGILAIL